MGIKHLNKYLRVECAKSITCMDMKELANKTIVIDISIYMYKYQTDGTLIENIYLMASRRLRNENCCGSDIMIR